MSISTLVALTLGIGSGGRSPRELPPLTSDEEILCARARELMDAGVDVDVVNKVTEGRPDISDMLKNKRVDLIVNTTEGRQAIADSAIIRRLALQNKVCYTTTLAGGEAFCIASRFGKPEQVRRLQDLHAILAR